MEGLLSSDGRAIGREFFERARARLTLDVPPALTDHAVPAARGDLDLDPSLWERAGVAATRPAAVLVGVVDRPGPTVLLTLRNADLESHAGQIAFPGGKIEASDASPAAAALREAEEEIGLSREFIDPIGYLDLYGTGLGFRIVPTVARVRPGFKLRINTSEVDDAFEVPLAFLMNPGNHQLIERVVRGVDRRFYAMPWDGRYIWGATAGMLMNLYQRLYAP